MARAKKVKDPAPVEAESSASADAPSGPRVLVLVGHDESGAPLTRDSVPDEPYQVRDREIHIGGQPYVHSLDAADGAWIYAPRHSGHR